MTPSAHTCPQCHAPIEVGRKFCKTCGLSLDPASYVIHQIGHSLNYVAWKDRKAFVADVKKIYQAPTREAGEEALLDLANAGAGSTP